MATDLDFDSAKTKHNLVTYVSGLVGKDLRPGDKLSCPFPWHADRTPSFHLGRDGESWRCWGCGLPSTHTYGDVIDLVGYLEFGQAYDERRDSFRALERLEGKPPSPAPPKSAPPPTMSRPTIDPRQVNEWARAMGDRERAYWARQGVQPETLDKFGIGWDGKRYSIPHRFKGVVTGVKLRRDDDLFPYIGKYLYVRGSKFMAPYNIDRVWESQPRKVVIVEDEKSVWVLSQMGHVAVSAPAGSWRPIWSAYLSAVPEVVVVFDWDEAGLKNGEKIKSLLARAELVQAGCLRADGTRATDVHDMYQVNPDTVRNLIGEP